MESDSHSDEEIKQIFSFKKIAVVGMSRHTTKAAHFVPKYLTEQGFDITPVNPNSTEILGKKSYPDVSSIDHPVDIVDIFRPCYRKAFITLRLRNLQEVMELWLFLTDVC